MTPKPKATLPPLARLFPSRFTAQREDSSLLAHAESLAHSPRRTFVELDEAPDGMLTTSPTSAEFAPIPQPSHREIPHEEAVAGSSSSLVCARGHIIRDTESDSAWELVGEIGQGAFSHVWKGRAVGSGDIVAVKVLARRTARHHVHRAERAAYRREVDVLRHLSSASHPALPTLHAAFSRASSDILVLEYIGGGELLDLVNSDEAYAKLTEGVLRRIWRELVGVVAWIHERNVVHRDIKLESECFLLSCISPLTISQIFS